MVTVFWSYNLIYSNKTKWRPQRCPRKVKMLLCCWLCRNIMFADFLNHHWTIVLVILSQNSFIPHGVLGKLNCCYVVDCVEIFCLCRNILFADLKIIIGHLCWWCSPKIRSLVKLLKKNFWCQNWAKQL